MLDGAADPFVVLGPDGAKHFVNRAWCELLDLQRDEALALPAGARVHPADRSMMMAGIAQGIDHPATVRILGRRGEIIRVTSYPTPLHDLAGNYIGILSVSRPSGPRRFVAEESAALKMRAGPIAAALARAHSDLTATEATRARVDDPLAGLTSREREIALLLADAAVPKEIAFDLDISVHTARNHIKAIYRKLGIHSHRELMLRCLREGA